MKTPHEEAPNREAITPARLKRQKIAGYVWPILLAWFLIVWNVLVTFFIAGYFPYRDWNAIPIIFSWLALVPLCGHAMGIVNVYCWRNQSYDEGKVKESLVLLGVFWLLTFPITLALIVSVIGFLVFPLHMVCFWGGQERGKRWIENDSINRFLGRTNEWEQEDLD